MAETSHKPRNVMLAGGITKYSRSAMYKKKALYKKKKVPVKAQPKKRKFFNIKDIKGERNGGKRVVLLRKSVCFKIKHTIAPFVILLVHHF